MMYSNFTIFMLIWLFMLNVTLSSHAASAKLSRDVNYDKGLNWIKDNNKWGKNAVVVNEFKEELDSAVGKKNAVWKVGWGITRSGKAYEVKWTPEGIFFTKVSPEQAQRLGYEEYSTICTIK